MAILEFVAATMYNVAVEQASSEIDGRSDTYDRLEFSLIYLDLPEFSGIYLN